MDIFIIFSIVVFIAFIGFVAFQSRGRTKTHTQAGDYDNSFPVYYDSSPSPNCGPSLDSSNTDAYQAQENCSSTEGDSTGGDLSCDSGSNSGSDSSGSSSD